MSGAAAEAGAPVGNDGVAPGDAGEDAKGNAAERAGQGAGPDEDRGGVVTGPVDAATGPVGPDAAAWSDPGPSGLSRAAGPTPSEPTALAAFRPFFRALLVHEGGLTVEAADPGNWTGGAVGRGSLRGTRYGISAAAYPEENIAALTVERAEALYFRDYWCRTGCDALPPLLRDLVFDSAVNNGSGNAARFLQRALGVADDGRVGPVTRAAIARADPVTLGEGFQRERASFHTKLSTWNSFGRGWAIRLATLPFQAMRLAGNGAGQE